MRERFEYMEEADVGSSGGSAAGEGQPTGQVDPAPHPSDWRSSLPPELRDSPSLKDVTDVASLAKQFVDTKSMVGNSLRVPSSEAGQEAIDAFTAKLLEHQNLPLMRRPDPESPEAMEALYKALGRPEDASGYALPEGADAEAFGAMAKEALALGLTKNQYETLAAKQLAMQQDVIAKLDQARMDSVAQVRGEWGMAFDEKVGRAVQVAKALKAPEKLIAALESGGVDGETLRFMDTVAAQLGAEGSPMAQQLGQIQTKTVAELQQRITDRVNRILTEENMSQDEKQRLIDANLEDQNQLIAARG